MNDDDFDLNGAVNKWRSFKKKYPFNKIIFNVGIIFLLFLLLIVWADYDFQNPRNIFFGEISCDETVCDNPVYYCNPLSSDYYMRDKTCDVLPESWFESEFLFEGQSLKLEPPFIIEFWGWIVFVVLGFCFGLNHWLNKRGKRK